jgi:thiol:disulfide interchange protein
LSSAGRPIFFIGAVVLGLTAIVGVSQWRAAHVKELVQWRTDLAQAQAEAKAHHKLVFTYFTATWCAPCQTLKETTWADPKVAAALEKRYVPVKIDVDTQKELALGYRIDYMPSFFILNEAGAPIRQDSGYMDEATMLAWIEKSGSDLQ